MESLLISLGSIYVCLHHFSPIRKILQILVHHSSLYVHIELPAEIFTKIRLPNRVSAFYKVYKHVIDHSD